MLCLLDRLGGRVARLPLGFLGVVREVDVRAVGGLCPALLALERLVSVLGGLAENLVRGSEPAKLAPLGVK